MEEIEKMIMYFVDSIKREEILKGEIDAWIMLSLTSLTRHIKHRQLYEEEISSKEKEALKELDALLEEHDLPQIYRPVYE